MRRALFAAPLLVALAVPSIALAQPNVDQAKALFNGGAQAYDQTRYADAILAFDQAYKLFPKPAILFSLAQAQRKQYVVTQKPEYLRAAIKSFQDYLAQVPQGGRRADAIGALSELVPIADRLKINEPGAAPAPEVVKPQTKVMVSSSRTRDAKVTLDGGKPVDQPLIQEVKPGPHKFKVSVGGYFDEEGEIVAVENQFVSVDVPMREQPARLVVDGPGGASVAVDGRPVGSIPLGRPVDVPPGKHFVAVTSNGSRAWSKEVDVARGEQKTLRAELPTTTQRKVAWVFMGTGAVAAIGGIVVGLGAAGKQNDAESILALQKKQPITEKQRLQYQDDKTVRDQYRGWAGGAFAAAALVGGTGIMLYAFDSPSVALPPPSEDKGAPKPGPKPDEPILEVRATPVVGPTFAGAAIGGRFSF